MMNSSENTQYGNDNGRLLNSNYMSVNLNTKAKIDSPYSSSNNLAKS